MEGEAALTGRWRIQLEGLAQPTELSPGWILHSLEEIGPVKSTLVNSEQHITEGKRQLIKEGRVH
jgi:hypothetical protein